MGKRTIGTIVENHYLPDKRKRRRANTVDGYESSLRLYVLPRFGGLEPHEIAREDVQDWVDGLVPIAGAGGAEKAYKCLRQVIRWAMDRMGLYIVDPTRGIELPRKAVYKPDVLTQRRLKRLIRGMVGCRYEATLIMSASLGLRPGECYALSWSDVNWRSGSLWIRQTLQETSEGVMLYPTKTAKSERECFLPAWALDRLHQIWVSLGRPRDRMIGTASPSKVASAIKRWISSHRLPKVTMRNLRHTWGTIAASSGVTIQDCAAMMGHSNIQTCCRYYYALTAAAARRAQRKVARRILGKTCEDMYKGIVLPIATVEIVPKAA